MNADCQVVSPGKHKDANAVVSKRNKSHLQLLLTRPSHHFKNALDCIKYTHRTEGIRGFWAGTCRVESSLDTANGGCR